MVCSQSEQPDKLSELRPEGRVRILKREGTYIKIGGGRICVAYKTYTTLRKVFHKKHVRVFSDGGPVP